MLRQPKELTLKEFFAAVAEELPNRKPGDPPKAFRDRVKARLGLSESPKASNSNSTENHSTPK